MVSLFISMLTLALIISLLYIYSLHRQMKVLQKINSMSMKSVEISEILRRDLTQQVVELKQKLRK